MFSSSGRSSSRAEPNHKGIVAVSCESDIFLASASRVGLASRSRHAQQFKIRANELLESENALPAQTFGRRLVPGHLGPHGFFKICSNELLKMKKALYDQAIV